MNKGILAKNFLNVIKEGDKFYNMTVKAIFKCTDGLLVLEQPRGALNLFGFYKGLDDKVGHPGLLNDNGDLIKGTTTPISYKGVDYCQDNSSLNDFSKLSLNFKEEYVEKENFFLKKNFLLDSDSEKINNINMDTYFDDTNLERIQKSIYTVKVVKDINIKKNSDISLVEEDFVKSVEELKPEMEVISGVLLAGNKSDNVFRTFEIGDGEKIFYKKGPYILDTTVRVFHAKYTIKDLSYGVVEDKVKIILAIKGKFSEEKIKTIQKYIYDFNFDELSKNTVFSEYLESSITDSTFKIQCKSFDDL